MRLVQTILAVTTVLTATSLAMAEKPFKFGDWAPRLRKSTKAVDEASVSQNNTGFAAPVSGQQTKNYSRELFGALTPELTPELTPDLTPEPTPGRASLAAAQEEPPSRPELSMRQQAGNSLEQTGVRRLPSIVPTSEGRDRTDSSETLRRFDKFLESSAVRQVRFDQPDIDSSSASSTVSDASHADSPTDRDRGFVSAHSRVEREQFADNRSSAQGSFVPWATAPDAASGRSDARVGQKVFTSRFSFAETSPTTAPKAAPTTAIGNRLTDAIPTTPVTPVSESHTSRVNSHARKIDPFFPEDVPQEHAPSDELTAFPAAAADSHSRSPADEFRVSSEHLADISPSVALPSATMHAPSSPEEATIVTAAWKLKGAFNIGQECPCEIVVKNQCGAIAEEVRVETRLPASLRIVDAQPSPSEHNGVWSWQLQDLAPGEQQTIQVLVIATEPGPVEVAAHVRYTASQVQSLTVAEPKLSVAVNGPTDVSVGEPASQTVIIHNPGTGVATNIVLEAQVPAGLEHVRGKDLAIQIGSLNPGETRPVRLPLAAVAGGLQTLQVEARTDTGLIERASAQVNVVAPKLHAAIDGPGLRYLGREATYVLRVENEGSAATDTVQMLHRIPDGFEYVRSDRGARFDRESGTLTWFVGRLDPNQPQELRVTLLASQAGEFVHAVRAVSGHGSHSDAQMATRVEGTASLVMKVADLDDPVEVDTETAYDVTITNEGTASAQHVGLACEMPDGLAFLDASGPSPHRADTDTVQFQPIAELRAGQSMKYRIHVRGNVTGDKRFRCRLSSADLSQPLLIEEFTKIYGE